MLNPYDIIEWAKGFHDEIGGPSKGEKEILDMWRGMEKWTTEPPKQAGWYWAKWMKDDDKTIVLITTLTQTDTHLVSIVPGFAQPFELHCFHLWLGPLPVPVPPTE